jgi:hypothetical protein
MENLYLDQIPKSFKLGFLSRDSYGANGVVYRTSNPDVLYKELDYFTEGDQAHENRYKMLQKCQSDSIVFPTQLVFVKKGDTYVLKGYLMPLIKGQILKETPRSIVTDTYIKAVEYVDKDIKEQTINGLSLEDVNYKNIMFTTDNQIKLIDTDLYDFSYPENPRDLLIENLKEINPSLLMYVFPEFYLNTGSKAIDDMFYEARTQGTWFAHKVLTEIKTYLENISGQEMTTVNAMQKTLALVRKK